jgi:DUF4097 and DUF4098 domain-containing protein YvlB
MFRTFGCAVLLSIAVPIALAQDRGGMDCDDSWSDRPSHCEIREETLGGGNPLNVDASPNGGIRVRGWDRQEVQLRVRVVAHADSEDQARQIVSQVQVETGGGQIRARGPRRSEDASWTASFELNVPQQSKLTLRTVNGGIAIATLQGSVDFKATNGGVSLEDVGGDIRGTTTNGGLAIDLTGDRWNGSGLDVETHNGGVKMTLPAAYSAELETGTTNGRVRVDFPITVQGLVGKQLHTTLGAGGPKIRAMTHNGGVDIRRR